MAHEMTEIQDIPTTTIESFFNCDDTSNNLKKFVDSIKQVKEQNEPTYFWPTENDPNSQEVINWAINNATEIFPNLASENM